MADNCIRKRIQVDGDPVYVIVGQDFAHVTGRFENRVSGKPVSMAGAKLINETITELFGVLVNGEQRKDKV